MVEVGDTIIKPNLKQHKQPTFKEDSWPQHLTILKCCFQIYRYFAIIVTISLPLIIIELLHYLQKSITLSYGYWLTFFFPCLWDKHFCFYNNVHF